MNNTQMKMNHLLRLTKNITHLLIYLYILTIPFQSIGFNFKGFNIGLPEMVFLLLTPLTIINGISSGQKLWVDKLDLFFFGLLFANIIAGWHIGFDSIVLTEIMKTAYLVLLYMTLKWTISTKILTRVVRVIILSSIFAALTGIIGFGLGYINIETFLAIKRPHPYLIHVTQARGFTPSPNMLASIIMIGIFFQTHNVFNKKNFNTKSMLVLITLLIGFLLTFSKTIVCLAIGICLIWYFNKKTKLSFTYRMFIKTVVASLFILYVLGTHILFVGKNQDSNILKGAYISGLPIIAETSYFTLFPSHYWALKDISLKAINQSFPWGLGPGNFNYFAHTIQDNKPYHLFTSMPDPHSTYFGTIAENGLLGLIILLALIFSIWKYSSSIVNNQTLKKHYVFTLPAIFFAISVEAISTDVLGFRQYLILLVLLALSRKTITKALK